MLHSAIVEPTRNTIMQIWQNCKKYANHRCTHCIIVLVEDFNSLWHEFLSSHISCAYGSPSNPVVIRLTAVFLMRISSIVYLWEMCFWLLLPALLAFSPVHVKRFIMSSLSNEGTQPHTNRHIFIVVKLYAVCIYSHSVDSVWRYHIYPWTAHGIRKIVVTEKPLLHSHLYTTWLG